ncbi:hypothetical protein ACET3Z_025556 [Daucus carota]
MKTRFIEINEKATGFLFKNIIHGDLKKENSLSAKEDEKYVGFKKQSTLLWSLVNSDKEDDNMIFFKWRSVFACKLDFQSLNFGEMFGILNATTKIPFERLNQVFVENMDDVQSLYNVRLSDLRMIFFPMIASNHHYVVTYDLRTPSMEILDNRRSNKTLNQLYGDQIDNLHKHFLLYLKTTMSINHMSYVSILPERLVMDCQTVHNDMDCGVFAMHHMSSYYGGGDSGWKDRLIPESFDQMIQLKDLRQDILHTMLTSVHNEKMGELQKIGDMITAGGIDKN